MYQFKIEVTWNDRLQFMDLKMNIFESSNLINILHVIIFLYVVIHTQEYK